MSSVALNISKEIKEQKLGVIDIYKIKPLSERIFHKIKKYKKIFCLEEHNEVGGIGTILSDFIHDKRLNVEVVKLSLKQKTIFGYGSRDILHKKNLIETKQLIKTLLKETS